MTEATRQTIQAIIDADKEATPAERKRVRDALLDAPSAKRPPFPELYTQAEVARVFHTSVQTVRRMRKRGEVRTVFVGGRPHIPSSALEAFA